MGLGRVPWSPEMGLFRLSGWDGGPATHFLKIKVKKIAAQDAPVSSRTFETQGPYLTLPPKKPMSLRSGSVIRNPIFWPSGVFFIFQSYRGAAWVCEQAIEFVGKPAFACASGICKQTKCSLVFLYLCVLQHPGATYMTTYDEIVYIMRCACTYCLSLAVGLLTCVVILIYISHSTDC